MRKLKRKILFLLGGLVLLAIVAVVLVLVYIDVIAKRGIEWGTSSALGVDAKVDGVAVHLFGGQLNTETMSIDNPPGYETDHLMKFDRLDVAVEPNSLWGDTIIVDHIEIDNLDVNIEQKVGSNNVKEILANIREGSEEKPEETKPGRKVKVKLVRVTNIVAHVQTLPIARGPSTFTVRIPEIRMENVTPEDSTGMMVGELVRQLFPAIIASVLEKGRDIIPVDFLKDLAGNVGDTVKTLGANAAGLVKQTGSGALDLIGKTAGGLLDVTGKGAGALKEGAGSIIEGAGKGADKLKEGAGGLLDKVIGGKKDEQ